jgi:tRNA-dihydrouridine synthase B
MPAPAFPIPLCPPVLLAPMAGITDLPFRRVVAGFGAGLVVSEMIASGELVARRQSSRARARIAADVPTAVQLAGREPGAMAEAARIAEGEGAPLIDINMGCPAKKVVGGLSGAALMRDLDLALRLIEAVVRAVRVPVTLKTRLGWDDGLPERAGTGAAGRGGGCAHGRRSTAARGRSSIPAAPTGGRSARCAPPCASR